MFSAQRDGGRSVKEVGMDTFVRQPAALVDLLDTVERQLNL